MQQTIGRTEEIESRILDCQRRAVMWLNAEVMAETELEKALFRENARDNVSLAKCYELALEGRK